MAILLLPFKLVWSFTAFILQMVGRLIAIVLGLTLLLVGGLLIITIVGAPVGVPLALLGFTLLLRALF
ncbi:MAG: hypothetical protein HZC41_20270 [Chloroflexi bacterium]|nr:hypothetical protein [Chloroflexota bacterium]